MKQALTKQPLIVVMKRPPKQMQVPKAQ